jgi:hypothetical protein
MVLLRGRSWVPWLGSASLPALLGASLAGCSLALGITDVILAPDRSDASDASSADDATACSQDLSYAYKGPFTISFTIKTLQTDAQIALVNQRTECSVGMFWDVRLVDGFVYVELSDFPSGRTPLVSSGPTLNDGNPHEVAVRRRAGVAELSVDAIVSASAMAPQSFEQLPPLQFGTDVCETDGTAPLHGLLTNLCVKSE